MVENKASLYIQELTMLQNRRLIIIMRVNTEFT